VEGVFYVGRICEVGTTDELFEPTYHPYTETLLSAILLLETDINQREIRLEGTMPNAIDPMPDCDFHTRCSKKIGDICDQSASADVEVKPGLNIASHILTSIPYLSMELGMFSDAYC
jgi:peptide/nickel transport system ATP-binding protein